MALPPSSRMQVEVTCVQLHMRHFLPRTRRALALTPHVLCPEQRQPQAAPTVKVATGSKGWGCKNLATGTGPGNGVALPAWPGHMVCVKEIYSCLVWVSLCQQLGSFLN